MITFFKKRKDGIAKNLRSLLETTKNADEAAWALLESIGTDIVANQKKGIALIENSNENNRVLMVAIQNEVGSLNKNITEMNALFRPLIENILKLVNVEISANEGLMSKRAEEKPPTEHDQIF